MVARPSFNVTLDLMWLSLSLSHQVHRAAEVSPARADGRDAARVERHVRGGGAGPAARTTSDTGEVHDERWKWVKRKEGMS